MRPLLRVLILCLPLLTIPAMPVHAAAPPIYPPASVFVFPTSIVGGTTKIDSSNSNRPPKAVSVVSYAVYPVDSQSQASTIGYDVSNFRSQVDATQYDNLLRMDSHNRLTAIAYPVAPKEWLSVNMHLNYVDIGAGLVYRNLELNVGIEIDYSNLAYKKQQQIAQQAILPVLAMEVRLLARAQAFAAHPVNLPAPTPPIFPPDSVFALPPNAVRQPVKDVSEAFQSPAKSLDQAFGLFTHQHGSYSYFVTTFRSSTDAVQYDGNTKSGNHDYTLLRIRQPVTPGEWLKEDANVPPDSGTNGGPYGAISVGLVYRNLSVVVYVYVAYHDSPATKTSRMIQATQIALDTAAQLYGRAQAFAAHPFKASPTTPSLTPAQQARNKALHDFVAQM